MNVDGFSEIGEIEGIAKGIEWQNGDVSKEKLVQGMKRIQTLSEKVIKALHKNLEERKK